jgi:hypothetical protein
MMASTWRRCSAWRATRHRRRRFATIDAASAPSARPHGELECRSFNQRSDAPRTPSENSRMSQSARTGVVEKLDEGDQEIVYFKRVG